MWKLFVGDVIKVILWVGRIINTLLKQQRQNVNTEWKNSCIYLFLFTIIWSKNTKCVARMTQFFSFWIQGNLLKPLSRFLFYLRCHFNVVCKKCINERLTQENLCISLKKF